MVLAAGGCGHAAKGADEIGEIMITPFWTHSCDLVFISVGTFCLHTSHKREMRNVISLIEALFSKVVLLAFWLFMGGVYILKKVKFIKF